MTTSTDPIIAPNARPTTHSAPAAPVVQATPEHPTGPCPLCAERVELIERLSTDLTLNRPCGCVV